MKTIKVIDLLNRCYKGDNTLPQIVKFCDKLYYKGNSINGKSYYSDSDHKSLMTEIYNFVDLCLEVEIIEEPKEIEKIRNINIDMDGHEIERTPDNYELKEKINELIDAVNELKRGN